MTLLLWFVLAFSQSIQAQQAKEVTQQSQQWVGYMTSTRLSDHFSWWNDAHFVPNSFYIVRTGLTHHLLENVNFTAGYAFLGLPAGGVTKDLNRREHRPWTQLVVSNKLSEQWSHLVRIRYDARFRKRLNNGLLAEGYGFNHRLRFLVSFRKRFPGLAFHENWLPFLDLANEVHFNFGREIVYDHLNQNRVTATVGLQNKNISYQLGYMNRYVHLSTGYQLVMNHTLVLWIVHRFDKRSAIAPMP